MIRALHANTAISFTPSHSSTQQVQKTNMLLLLMLSLQFPLTAHKSGLLRVNEYYLVNFSQFQPPDFRSTLY